LRIRAVIGIYVAGIIGAGFASGHELYVFFVDYGWGGLVGLAVTLIMFTLGTFGILEFAGRKKVENYKELFSHLGLGNALIFDLIYSLFLITGISVMLAGCGALPSSEVSGVILQIATGFLVYFTVQKGVEGPVNASQWLAVTIVGVLSLFAIFHLQENHVNFPREGSLNGIESGVLYASFNLGFSMAILSSIQHFVKTRKERWIVAILGNIILVCCMLLLCSALSTLSLVQLNDPFPLIHLVQRKGSVAKVVYYIMLWCAMYTTALANSLALVKRLTSGSLFTWQQAAVLVVIVALILSIFGFTTLVRLAYPLLGMLGLFILIFVGRGYFRKI